MRIGINSFLFVSPFTTESVKLFPKFKKWGFDTVEIPIEDPVAHRSGQGEGRRGQGGHGDRQRLRLHGPGDATSAARRPSRRRR
jgi:hypothetical protein